MLQEQIHIIDTHFLREQLVAHTPIHMIHTHIHMHTRAHSILHAPVSSCVISIFIRVFSHLRERWKTSAFTRAAYFSDYAGRR